jgi:hypothetical protein
VSTQLEVGHTFSRTLAPSSVGVTPVSYIGFVGTLQVTGPFNFDQSTVSSFTRNLPELLAAMASDGRTLLCVAELEDGRYVQFWVEPSWSIFAEVVSNLNIRESDRLSPQDERELVKLGFQAPLPGFSPNWHYEATGAGSFARLVTMMTVAMALALHVSPADLIRITTWESSILKDA